MTRSSLQQGPATDHYHTALGVDQTAAEGGGVTVLEDPGPWQADHVYADGDRFAEPVDGAERVFEITVAGTSGGGVFADYAPYDLVPGGNWGTNSEEFTYLGVVGQLSNEMVPNLAPHLGFADYNSSGRALVYQSEAPPEESSPLFALNAMVDGAPLGVLEVKTDGDGDYWLDSDTGAGFRWSRRSVGDSSSTAMIISPTQFGVTGEDAGLDVDFSGRIDLNALVINMRGAVAAPSDGSLFNSSFALWLDATPGATKLMIKAKDSGGTVRTAAINLT